MVLKSISTVRISFIGNGVHKCRRGMEKDQLLAARAGNVTKSSHSGNNSRLTVQEAGKGVLAWVGIAIFVLVCLGLELVVGETR